MARTRIADSDFVAGKPSKTTTPMSEKMSTYDEAVARRVFGDEYDQTSDAERAAATVMSNGMTSDEEVREKARQVRTRPGNKRRRLQKADF